MINKTVLTVLSVVFLSTGVNAHAQNGTFQSFSKSKKVLLKNVYYDYRKTIYCDAEFTVNKQVIPPEGFTTRKHLKRAGRIEWEHIVPAENFGRTFSEWRDGHTQCVDKKGKSFKGRNCASKVNEEYRYMQSDMYNLAPAIGAVNAMRSNYNFTMLADGSASFGSCEMIISDRKVQPPAGARGEIARTYKYMEWAYPRYSMSRQQRQLMDAWDKMYPVSDWECKRASRIEKLQGNDNPFVNKYCSGETSQSTLSQSLSAPLKEFNNPDTVIFHGNTKSRVYHGPNCQWYKCKNCTVKFPSIEDAEAAGYTRCGGEKYQN